MGLRASASQTDQRHAGTDFDAGPLLANALLADPAVPSPRGWPPLGRRCPRQLLYSSKPLTVAPRTRRLLVQLSTAYQLSPALRLTLAASREQADTRQLSFSSANFAGTLPNVVRLATSTTSNHNWVGDATAQLPAHVSSPATAAHASLVCRPSSRGRQLEETQ